MKTQDQNGKPFWKDPLLLSVFVGSSSLFSGLAFGYMRVFTQLPLWTCILLALPSGVLVFTLILWLHIWSDAPPR